MAANYIGCRQGVVSQWVALQPIFELCATEKGYEGRGRGWGLQEGRMMVSGGAVDAAQVNF